MGLAIAAAAAQNKIKDTLLNCPLQFLSYFLKMEPSCFTKAEFISVLHFEQ